MQALLSFLQSLPWTFILLTLSFIFVAFIAYLFGFYEGWRIGWRDGANEERSHTNARMGRHTREVFGDAEKIRRWISPS